MIIEGIPYLQTSSEIVPDLTIAKVDFLIVADFILSLEIISTFFKLCFLIF